MRVRRLVGSVGLASLIALGSGCAPDSVDDEVSAEASQDALTDARVDAPVLRTNDNYVGTDVSYRKKLGKVIDTLLAKGIAPLVSTIPPRTQAGPNANIPRMNLIVRDVASAKRVPLMDFHAALANLPHTGLSGDGVHPNVGSRGACDFSQDGLTHGYNVRTLLALEALDRVKRFVLDGAAPEAR